MRRWPSTVMVVSSTSVGAFIVINNITYFYSYLVGAIKTVLFVGNRQCRVITYDRDGARPRFPTATTTGKTTGGRSVGGDNIGERVPTEKGPRQMCTCMRVHVYALCASTSFQSFIVIPPSAPTE